MAENKSGERTVTRRQFIIRPVKVAIGVALAATATTASRNELVQRFFQGIADDAERIGHLASRDLSPNSTTNEDDTEWWRELSREEIKTLTEIPELVRIDQDQRYVSTVTPQLQEKAQRAGYKLIYQGDPEDTSGRTVMAGRRQIHERDDDLGFGMFNGVAGGTFEAWVPDPDDPQQKKGIYALLKDPTRNINFIVRFYLEPFDPNKFVNGKIFLPTILWVDNLDYGPDIIREKSEAAGFNLQSSDIPDPDDPPEVKWKAPKTHRDQFLYDLIRIQGYDLTDIAKPGDSLSVTIDGVSGSNSILARRFGGFQQWKKEAKGPVSK